MVAARAPAVDCYVLPCHTPRPVPEEVLDFRPRAGGGASRHEDEMVGFEEVGNEQNEQVGSGEFCEAVHELERLHFLFVGLLG